MNANALKFLQDAYRIKYTSNHLNFKNTKNILYVPIPLKAKYELLMILLCDEMSHNVSNTI